MHRKWRFAYNAYFLVPFIAWVIGGGFTLIMFAKRDLFLSINGRSSSFGDVSLYYITMLGQAEIIIPTLFLLLIFPRFRNWWYITTALLCNLVPFFIQHFIKDWLNWPRPQLVFKNVAPIHFLPDWPVLLHSSFPSGHSQGAFSFFCFLSLVLSTRFRKAGILCFLLALSVGYSRIYLAAHFFEDVYVGSIIGTVGTTLVFSVMIYYRDAFFPKKDTFTK